MEKWINILSSLYNECPIKEIIRKYHINLEHFNKYIQMFFDSNYIIIVYNSNFQVIAYRITEKGKSVLKANNLINGGKKKHGKAPKNTQEITTGNQRNPERNASSIEPLRNHS